MTEAEYAEYPVDNLHDKRCQSIGAFGCLACQLSGRQQSLIGLFGRMGD